MILVMTLFRTFTHAVRGVLPRGPRGTGARTCAFAVFATIFCVLGPTGAFAQSAYLNNLVGSWSGQGRAAGTGGEIPISCDVTSQFSGPTVEMMARCQTPSQSGNLAMSLYYSDMSRSFHGKLSSPLRYMRGPLHGRLDRGDLFLRLSAEDGGSGRLVFVSEGEGRIRLLVTTMVNGTGVTVLDLPLQRI
ncbi:MAG: hypothetical protein AAGH60_03060 [Pseudomonadota bacterium]